MNAVERLLRHAERALDFFDDVFRDRFGSAADLPDGVSGGKLQMLANAAIDRLDRLRGWDSSLAMFAACERVLLRLPPSERPRLALDNGGKQVAEEYFAMTEERQQLLDSSGVMAMLADVVVGSSAWGPLSERSVVFAETVADALKRVRQLESELDPDDWATERLRLREAIDALLPYSQPPAPTVPAEKKTGGSSKRSGRPQNDEDLARDLLAGWRAYEPEEGRKTKDRYLAQRPDVRVLKTEDARQRKIASLGVALDSALHLRREKTKQKKRLRG